MPGTVCFTSLRGAEAWVSTRISIGQKLILEAVRLAIAAGCDNANAQNKIGRTPLHEVAQIGDSNLLKIMFKLHADANIHDKDDKTAVHVAAEKGNTDMVESLIDKFGGSIRARTKDGSTLLHIAASSGHTSTALAFLKRGKLAGGLEIW